MNWCLVTHGSEWKDSLAPAGNCFPGSAIRQSRAGAEDDAWDAGKHQRDQEKAVFYGASPRCRQLHEARHLPARRRGSGSVVDSEDSREHQAGRAALRAVQAGVLLELVAEKLLAGSLVLDVDRQQAQGCQASDGPGKRRQQGRYAGNALQEVWANACKHVKMLFACMQHAFSCMHMCICACM